MGVLSLRKASREDEGTAAAVIVPNGSEMVQELEYEKKEVKRDDRSCEAGRCSRELKQDWSMPLAAPVAPKLCCQRYPFVSRPLSTSDDPVKYHCMLVRSADTS